MEPNNYNGIHIISEAVVVGSLAMYFYKKISDMETAIEDLKAQVTMQNNQIRYLIGSNPSHQSSFSRPTTPLNIPKISRKENQEQVQYPPQKRQECNGGICKLVTSQAPETKKMVSIAKISKQIEFDRENMEPNQTSKVKTFTKPSPNPVLKSVTPNPSEIVDIAEPSELDKILNDIDDE